MVSFPQVSAPKPFTRLSPPPYALHAPPISFSILSSAQYWVEYRSLSSSLCRFLYPLLPRSSYAQIFSSIPSSPTPSAYVLPSMLATKGFKTIPKNNGRFPLKIFRYSADICSPLLSSPHFSLHFATNPRKCISTVSLPSICSFPNSQHSDRCERIDVGCYSVGFLLKFAFLRKSYKTYVTECKDGSSPLLEPIYVME